MFDTFERLVATRHAKDMYRRKFVSMAYKTGRKLAEEFTKNLVARKEVGTEQYSMASTMWDASEKK